MLGGNFGSRGSDAGPRAVLTRERALCTDAEFSEVTLGFVFQERGPPGWTGVALGSEVADISPDVARSPLTRLSARPTPRSRRSRPQGLGDFLAIGQPRESHSSLPGAAASDPDSRLWLGTGRRAGVTVPVALFLCPGLAS